jgi:hypothetical protein
LKGIEVKKEKRGKGLETEKGKEEKKMRKGKGKKKGMEIEGGIKGKRGYIEVKSHGSPRWRRLNVTCNQLFEINNS